MPRLVDRYADDADILTDVRAVEVPPAISTGDVFFSNISGTLARLQAPAMRYNSYARELVEERSRKLEQATGIAAQDWTADYLANSPYSDTLLYRPSRRAASLRNAIRNGTIIRKPDGTLGGMTHEADSLIEGNEDYVDRLFKLEALAKDVRAGILDDDAIEAATTQAIEGDVARMTDANLRGRGLVQGTAAFIGAAAGAVVADPEILAAGVVTGGLGGPIVSAGRTLAAQAGRAAILEGGTGLVTQLPVEIDALRLNESLRVPYTWKEAAFNTLAATLFGAGLGAAVPPIGAAFKTLTRPIEIDIQLADVYAKAKRDNPKVATPEADQAEATLRAAAEIQEAAPQLPPESQQLHAAIEAKARDDLEAGETPKIEQAITRIQAAANVEPDMAPVLPMRRTLTPEDLTAFDPQTLEVDAKLFQFKAGGDEAGVTDKLRDVTRYEPSLAGTVLVWEDKAGRRFIVDGHQRMGIARRAIAGGQDPKTVFLSGYVLREAEGVTPEWARTVAAIKNIAEGSGTAVDVAKIYRFGSREVLHSMPELSANNALARDGRNLSKLGDDAFGAVVNDIVRPEYGAVVGELIPDHAEQTAALDVLARSEPANLPEARAIVEQVRAVGFTRRGTASQGGLFGEADFAQSLFKERARILTRALADIRKDLSTFRTLVKRKGRIAEAGNKLAEAKNLAKVAEDEQVITEIQRLANTAGPVSDALNAAARGYAEGKALGASVDDFLGTVREAATRRDQPRAVAGEGQLVEGEDVDGPAGKALRARFEADSEAVFAEYAARPDAEGGRVLNTDTARELSPEYLANRTKAPEVHEAASDIVKALYAEKLANPTPAGMDRKVLFSAGGTGAGKSTAINGMGDAFGRPEIVYDTNTSTLTSAIRKIDQALEAGREVDIVYIYREPIDALVNGALKRAERQRAEFGSGRTIMLSEHMKTHVGSSAVVPQLLAKYADDPRVRSVGVDNSRGKGNQVKADITELPKVLELGLYEKLDKALEAEFAAGRISEATYRGFKEAEVPGSARSGQVRGELPQGDSRKSATDLLGNDTRAAQALADETARRDQARTSGQISLETGDPSDLFSAARKQANLFDEADAGRTLRAAEDLIADDPERLVTVTDISGQEVTVPASRLFDDLDAEDQALRRVALCATPGEA